MSNLRQKVNKRILFNALLVLLVLLGSFSLRELYSDNPIIKTVLSGSNILVFWAIMLFSIYKLDLWIFDRAEPNSQAPATNDKRLLLTKRVLILVAITLLIVFGSLKLFG